MLEFTGFLGLTRISFFCSHRSHRSRSIALWVGNLTDASVCGLAHTDLTLLLGSHGSHRSHGIALWVGNLTDASVRGLARADSTLLLGSHGSHRSHSIALWVGNLTDASVGGKSHRWLCGCGLLGAARGSLSRTYLLDPSDKSDLSDKSDGLDIFKNNP